MIKIENILVPLDLSEIAKHALTYAQELASACGARIHLLHVVETRGMELTGAVGALPTYGGLATDRFEEEAEKELARARDAIKGVEVESAVRIGSPQDEVVAYARNRDIDVIVMATHGRSGLSHALIGSVAEKVVQMAPCPVLTVKHPEHEFVKSPE